LSSDPGRAAGERGAAPGADTGPSEDELRAAYEAELSRITSTEMMLQAVVSLLNIGARRLTPPAAHEGAPGAGAASGDPASGRDLEQARDAIDAVRALLEILERRIPGELRSLRDALSQLQMAYAREVQASPAPDEAQAPAGGPHEQAAPPAGREEPAQGGRGPGPAESSGKLWVPGR
jgi:hypothetical protein